MAKQVGIAVSVSVQRAAEQGDDEFPYQAKVELGTRLLGEDKVLTMSAAIRFLICTIEKHESLLVSKLHTQVRELYDDKEKEGKAQEANKG
jgi:hypothetical protein